MEARRSGFTKVSYTKLYKEGELYKARQGSLNRHPLLS